MKFKAEVWEDKEEYDCTERLAVIKKGSQCEKENTQSFAFWFEPNFTKFVRKILLNRKVWYDKMAKSLDPLP